MLGLLLGGCGHDYTDIASSASRDTSPSTADVPQLTSSEAAFAFDFYRTSVGADTKTNVFFSPYSISVALAMTYAGTAGNTASQIASAMRFTLPPDRRHTAFDALDLALVSRKDVRLAIANSIWAQRTLAFGQPFLDACSAEGLRISTEADFRAEPPPESDALVIGYGNIAEAKLGEGLAALAALVERHGSR